MDDFTITYRGEVSMRWFQYLIIALGIIHFVTFGLDYWNNNLNVISYAFLTIAIVEVLIGLFRYEQYFFPYPELTFLDNQVEISQQKQQEIINWDDIQGITIGNSTISFNLNDGDKRDISIAYLNYGDIQTAKKKIKQCSETRDISYRSVY